MRGMRPVDVWKDEKSRRETKKTEGRFLRSETMTKRKKMK